MPYSTFLEKSSSIADLEAALALLNWDLEVMMPHGAANRRAGQISTLAGIKHQMTVKELKPVIEALRNSRTLTDEQRLNVSQAYETVDKVSRMPVEFVERMARTCSEAQQVWEHARKVSDFAVLEPILTQIFDLKRQEAEYYGYEDQPYDALLDSYEPGMTTDQVSQIFAALKPQIKGLYDVIRSAPAVDEALMTASIPLEAQRAINLELLTALGFNTHHGRCDISTHPFTIAMGMEDVRITTRMEERNIPMMLYGSIHEIGHAFYEMGLPASQYGLPGGQACSLSIHESQSRIWENNVGRSQAFMDTLLPILRRNAPGVYANAKAQDVFRAINAVKPSLIRTMADELTYHLHILLRFEIERDVVNGTASVSDIPTLWREKMQEYLGLEVPTDTEGELQDIHWSIGAIGYFPTYSLGSFYAAQFHHYAQLALPNLEDDFRRGEFAPFKNWLADNVWSAGRLYDSNTLCERITGKPLDVAYFLRYLQGKLSNVYSIALQA